LLRYKVDLIPVSTSSGGVSLTATHSATARHDPVAEPQDRCGLVEALLYSEWLWTQ